ncbi:flavodoxin domain-containing protein [Mogibacterium pumilum]|uniref:Flavodoxin domain-containing protein n=1 Tax=Mogibacterium pumilum TaxID=86332 RepID=A0A223ATM6_9FIRM|nr:flavodoxin domain-containing protein [Mogibacterium pumilum]ASS38308.1 hypothetical protein AXF17_07810 [Mogibacterium pumilum]
MRNPNRQAAKRRAIESEGSDTILIYNSSNGITEKYAEWIAEALDCDVMKYSRAKLGYASMYKNIIFGGWLRGGEITRFNMLRANLSHFGIDNNNLIVFTTGIIEPTEEYRTFVKGLNGCKQLPDDCFYMLPGKFDSRECRSADKIALKAMGEKIFAPVPEVQVDEAKARFENGYDGVDLKSIQPIIEKVLEFRQ